MEDKKVKKTLYASEARSDAKIAQSANYEKAIERIESQSKLGFEEVLLFGIHINLEGVKKLMDLGYSVTSVIHPFEQVKMYKVSWE
jgi:ribosome-binding ATPase YchF (GTP1/OBG family)